ncbi:MAG: hypothetical protein HQK69_08700, partial [Desulfamplus sp.]|nr:hypothetical protein [Desulfamplus sp.]
MKNFNAVKMTCVIFILMFTSIASLEAVNLPVIPASSPIETERQNWEFFTNRSNINVVLLSDDGSTLWVGSSSGLEKRDSVSGDIEKVYTKQNGLPN